MIGGIFMSNQNYDEQLGKIQHFMYHPELLPYVGDNYDKYKVLLIGESHYLVEALEDTEGKFLEWYDKPTSDFTMLDADDLACFNTRKTVEAGLSPYNNSKIFKNVSSVLFEILKDKSVLNPSNFSDDRSRYAEAFSYVAYFNYFQRPELSGSGRGFQPLKKDGTVIYKEQTLNYDKFEQGFAFDTADEIINILKPSHILFLSKRAYKSFKDYDGGDTDNLDFVHHPSRQWNMNISDTNETSKEKFARLINQYFS